MIQTLLYSEDDYFKNLLQISLPTDAANENGYFIDVDLEKIDFRKTKHCVFHYVQNAEKNDVKVHWLFGKKLLIIINLYENWFVIGLTKTLEYLL